MAISRAKSPVYTGHMIFRKLPLGIGNDTDKLEFKKVIKIHLMNLVLRTASMIFYKLEIILCFFLYLEFFSFAFI